MGKTSGRIHLKVNLKAKFSPFATVVNDTGGAPSSEYLREFSKKFEMAVMVYSHAWGKLIHANIPESKIS